MKPVIHETAFVADNATVRGNVTIGEGAGIYFGAVLRAETDPITVGPGSNIQDNCVLHVTHDGPYTPGGAPLVIGDDVTVGHGAILHACTIEDACLIGMHATVLDGAIVRKHGFVAAGAVIAPGKVVGEGELWMGNPARCVRKLSEREIERLYYSAQHYVRLKDRYLAGDA